MTDKRSKDKKRLEMQVFWGAVFVCTLLFTVIGLQFYMGLSDRQLSPVPETLLQLVILIFLPVALFAGKRLHKTMSKYVEEYGSNKRLFGKEIKISSDRTFTILICVAFFIIMILA